MGHYAPPSGRSVAIQIVRTPAQCFIVGEAAERPVLPPVRRCRNVCCLLKSSFQKADSLYAVPLKNINLFQNIFSPPSLMILRVRNLQPMPAFKVAYNCYPDFKIVTIFFHLDSVLDTTPYWDMRLGKRPPLTATRLRVALKAVRLLWKARFCHFPLPALGRL